MKLVVEGMTCGHCVLTITSAIQKLDPAASVDIDVSAGEVRIRSNSVAAGTASQAIQDAGYAVVGLLDQDEGGNSSPASSNCCGSCHA